MACLLQRTCGQLLTGIAGWLAILMRKTLMCLDIRTTRSEIPFVEREQIWRSLKTTNGLAMPQTPFRRSVLAILIGTTVALSAGALVPTMAAAQDAKSILRATFDNWRADSSHVTTSMTINRGSGMRNLAMESWTQGEKKALVRFTAPARDAGNATLQVGNSTHVFNPKLNQVIKLPASAMSRSWMGSDFSYDDLARSDKVIDDYTHTLKGMVSVTGGRAHVIESVPKRGVPVVWGKQVLTIRTDGVLMEVEYYDQVGKRVRVMTTDRVERIGGRPYPVVMTMRTDAKPGQFTRIATESAEFDIPIPAYLFTKSNLQNPRN
ncbi:MAG: outer membrane lipoprotein-sorting protein [Boseongicola sp. SB0676_bin_33]|nr:outer membrane lipoprotein-sorting protein [Boseongicola sp. SB0676_bin_33]